MTCSRSPLTLIVARQELADYVIVHELLHFYVPNHGKLWKSLMRRVWATMGVPSRRKAAMLSGQHRR
jgi:hypothetical protein